MYELRSAVLLPLGEVSNKTEGLDMEANSKATSGRESGRLPFRQAGR